MTPKQCLLAVNRLKTALTHSEAEAKVVFDAHSSDSWFKVMEHAVKHGNGEVAQYLLRDETIKEKVIQKIAFFLRLIYSGAHASMAQMLMSIPEFNAEYISMLSVRLHVLLRDAPLNIVEYFMSINEVRDFAAAHSTNTLVQAINRGNLAIVKFLFSLEYLFDNDINRLALLENAALVPSYNILEYLLQFEEFRDIASQKNQKLIRISIAKKDIRKLNLLLDIPHVLDDVKRDITIMKTVISSNQDEIIDRFLEISELRSTLNTQHLFTAVADKNPRTVKYLLSINKIARDYQASCQHILRTASHSINNAIVMMLLEKSPATSIPLDIFSRLYHANLPSDIIAKLFDRPLAIQGRCVDKKKIDSIKAWADHWGLEPYPLSYEINPIRWSDYLYNQMLRASTPKSAAIILLSLQEMATIRSKHFLPELPPSSDENAMDAALVSKSAKHFKEHIEPYYKEKFQCFGGVEGIERRIKALILEKLMEHKQNISEEIAKQKEALLNDDDDAMQWMLSHCQDIADIYETSWRSYDKNAPVTLFPNLLTAPLPEDAQNPLYSIPETGLDVNAGLKSASDIIRERTCYFYLLVTDERMTPNEWDTALEKFIAALADMRRSNNSDEDEPIDGDSPSCFPGSITHLSKIACLNPYIPPMDFYLYEDIQTYFRSQFSKTLVSAFLKCTDQQSVAQLVDALTMLTHTSAWDIIKKPWMVDCPSLATGPDDDHDHPYDATLLARRIALMRQYFNPYQMLKAYDHQKPNYANISITQNERVFMQDCMADPARGDIAQLIISCANARTLALERLVQEQGTVANTSNITGQKRSAEGQAIENVDANPKKQIIERNSMG